MVDYASQVSLASWFSYWMEMNRNQCPFLEKEGAETPVCTHLFFLMQTEFKLFCKYGELQLGKYLGVMYQTCYCTFIPAQVKLFNIPTEHIIRYVKMCRFFLHISVSAHNAVSFHLFMTVPTNLWNYMTFTTFFYDCKIQLNGHFQDVLWRILFKMQLEIFDFH